jgi:hypothetical protein
MVMGVVPEVLLGGETALTRGRLLAQTLVDEGEEVLRDLVADVVDGEEMEILAEEAGIMVMAENVVIRGVFGELWYGEELVVQVGEDKLVTEREGFERPERAELATFNSGEGLGFMLRMAWLILAIVSS